MKIHYSSQNIHKAESDECPHIFLKVLTCWIAEAAQLPARGGEILENKSKSRFATLLLDPAESQVAKLTCYQPTIVYCHHRQPQQEGPYL